MSTIKIIPKGTTDQLTVYIRPDTTDIKVIDEVLKRNVYQLKNIDFKLEPNELWLDCGGNIGTFSLMALSKGCSVITYEPEPDNLRLLEKNLTTNFPTHKKSTESNFWSIEPYALGITENTIPLYLCKGTYNKYRHTVFKVRGRQTIDIKVIKFNDEMNKYRPYGVKMDIEGSEIEILEHIFLKDWEKWNTQKLVFEYSFDRDKSIPRFFAIIDSLKKYFTIVKYLKCINPNEPEYNYYPPMTMVYCMR